MVVDINGFFINTDMEDLQKMIDRYFDEQMNRLSIKDVDEWKKENDMKKHLTLLKNRLLRKFHKHNFNYYEDFDPFTGTKNSGAIKIEYYDSLKCYHSVHLKFYQCSCGDITAFPHNDFIKAYEYSELLRTTLSKYNVVFL